MSIANCLTAQSVYRFGNMSMDESTVDSQVRPYEELETRQQKLASDAYRQFLADQTFADDSLHPRIDEILNFDFNTFNETLYAFHKISIS